MTFDAAPSLPIDITKAGNNLDVRAEIQLNGSYVDVTPYVLMDTTTITRGHPDESTSASPSTLSGTLFNGDGRFSQLNPTGPYYPYLGLNTPIRVSIPAASSHLRLEGDNTSYAQIDTFNTTGVSYASGFQVVIDADADSWRCNQAVAGQWGASGSFSWAVVNSGDGLLHFWFSGDGVNIGIATTSAPVPVTRGRISLRFKYVPGSQQVTVYYGLGNPNTVTWIALGNSLTVNATPIVSTQAIQVGNVPALAGGGWNGFTGKIYAAIMTNTSGTLNFAAAFWTADLTTITPGTTTFVDAQSNTWKLYGTSEVSNREYRFHGQVAAWPQAWSPQSANATVALSASGLLRRMANSQVSTLSALRRAYVRLTGTGTYPWAYWPCEDGSGAVTQAASAIGGTAAQWTGTPTPASYSGFLSSGSLPVLNGATLTCVVPKYTSNAGIVLGSGPGGSSVTRFLLAVPSTGDAGTSQAGLCTIYYDNSSTVAKIDVFYTNSSGGLLGFTAYSQTGTQLWTANGAFGVNGQNVRLSIETQNLTSSTYNGAIVMQNVNGATPTLIYAPGTSSSTGVSGTVGNVTRIVFNPAGGVQLTATAIGHITVQSQWTSLFNLAAPLQAWVGESAGNRFMRLCNEEGIQWRLTTAPNGSTPLGAQTMATISALLQELADADQGMLYETRQCLGFGYRTRASIGNSAYSLTLDYVQDHLSDDLQPTHDDQTVKNDVTVTNQATGSTADMVLSDGSAMAVNTIGRYDTSTTLNLAYDTQNADAAGWMLHAKTVNEPRYTAINVDLANSNLLALWYTILQVDIGDRIQVVNPPVFVPPGNIDQIVQGVTEVLSLKDLRESWNGVPATPWNIVYLDQDPGNGTADDPYAYTRCDTDGSVLMNAPAAGATSLVVDATDPTFPLWTTNAGDLPFDIAIAGERMTVTAIGAQGQAQLGLADGDFESGVSQWSVSGGTVAQSTVQAHTNTHSALLTVTGTPTQITLRPNNPSLLVPVLAGNQYTASMWVYCGGAVTISAVIDWRGPTGSLVGSPTSAPFAIAANTWTQITVTGTPNAGAVFAGYGPTLGGSPATGTFFYLDTVTFTTLGQVFTVSRGVNGVNKAQAIGSDVRLFVPPILSY